jgi:hypothetical protein
MIEKCLSVKVYRLFYLDFFCRKGCRLVLKSGDKQYTEANVQDFKQGRQPA